MGGHLQIHPYYNTYDELQRSVNRMKNYRDINKDMLDESTIVKVNRLIALMEEGISYIPHKYHLTKREQQRLFKGE